MRIEGNRAIVSFTHTGGGLVAQGGALKGFTIAGENDKFFPAQANIEGETIVVTSDKIAMPKTVRFGWGQVPDVNLFNREGLPAVPFTAR
jgi:sialate O-acetylesterase